MPTDTEDFCFEDFDERYYPRADEPELARIVRRRMSRRDFLATAMFGASSLAVGCAGFFPGRAVAAGRLEFEAVAANSLDTVTVPAGYQWQVVVSWGDGLWSHSPPFDEATCGTGASQELAFGDNNDGMALFTHAGRHLLAVNNEYVNGGIMYRNRGSRRPENADDVRKGKAGHGVTLVEIEERQGRWRIVLDSEFNRRITPDTPMQITGPARGHEWLRTAADPAGIESLGTWSNCGCGRTPWGTYLSCEENFNAYFSSSDAKLQPTRQQFRYGIGLRDAGYGWASVDERFDISKHPNEPHRAGYVVEIDPLDPASKPKKRTALGRFKHENAEVALAADGRVVVYLGDDERGEFLYRYVSTGRYRAGADPDELLDEGQLYAARFDDRGRGRWIALTPASTGMASRAEICIYTREAASRAGATTMDRPEWVACHPGKAEVYCALTNNKDRGRGSNRGGDPMPVGGPNPRANNYYGQILRWRPLGGDHAGEDFAWDLFALGGNPAVHEDAYAGSANINPGNMFNAPDCIAFDRRGRLWILTDGSDSNRGAFAGMGNNQVLCGDPVTGEIRRFMVGPRECEMTGICWSPDFRTLFVGIQHPGAQGDGHFPGGGGSVPRSSIVAVRRDDGGLLG